MITNKYWTVPVADKRDYDMCPWICVKYAWLFTYSDRAVVCLDQTSPDMWCMM